MPSNDLEQVWRRLWLIQMELSNMAGRLGAVEKQVNRQDDRHTQDIKDSKDKSSWVQILTAVAPFLYGAILLIAVILGKLTLSEAGSMLLSK
jgi:diacylglycerol kinase